MRIKYLYLKNIGPFKEARIDFYADNQNASDSSVTIITGENGTGKTIVLDAIRAVLLGEHGSIERNIVRDEKDFSVFAGFNIPQNKKVFRNSPVKSNTLNSNNRLKTSSEKINALFLSKSTPFFITNYWTSRLASDSFELKSLVSPKVDDYLVDSLNGIQPNVEVTQLICFFDYLRSSNNNKEKELGEYLYELLKKIIKLSLIDGEFRYVERRTLTPIIYQTGKEISLDKLSSGNLYLIQRMVSLLGQMYAVHVLHNTPIDELCNTPGLLMIDEAENHLHPKWQKTFLNSILEIFPNLQIIVTTHSPFIVSSVTNANVYVCRSKGDHSIIENQTAVYSNKPIEEILLSPVFNTSNFNHEISNLLYQRKLFISSNKLDEAQKIEQRLLTINPDYFSYLEVEKILESISNQDK